MSTPKWACSVCGMFSGRRESVMRHINNPRIHAGRALTIPFIDYISGIRNRIQGQSLTDKDHSGINTVIKTPKVENGFYDRLWKKVEQINLERLAESIANGGNAWQHQGQYAGRSPSVRASVIRRVMHYSGEKIFAIRGVLCSKCFTIEPIVYAYGFSAKANMACVTHEVHTECKDEYSMSQTEAQDYLKYNSTNGFPQAVRQWIKTLWSSNSSIRIIALKLPDSQDFGYTSNNISDDPLAEATRSCGGSLKGARNNGVVISLIFDETSKSYLLPQEKKEFTLFYDSSDFFDLTNHSDLGAFERIPKEEYTLSNESGAIRKNIVEKVIKSSELTINSESELLEFLRYTKFGTFGFFQIGSPISSNSVSSEGSGFYLLFLSPSEFNAGGKFRACPSAIKGSVF